MRGVGKVVGVDLEKRVHGLFRGKVVASLQGMRLVPDISGPVAENHPAPLAEITT